MREINIKVNRAATVKKTVLDSTYSFWMGYVSMKRWYAYFYEKCGNEKIDKWYFALTIYHFELFYGYSLL